MQNWSLYLSVLSFLFESCQKRSGAQRVIQNSITTDGLGERLRTMASLKLFILASTVRQQSANNIKVSCRTVLVGVNLLSSNVYRMQKHGRKKIMQLKHIFISNILFLFVLTCFNGSREATRNIQIQWSCPELLRYHLLTGFWRQHWGASQTEDCMVTTRKYY